MRLLLWSLKLTHFLPNFIHGLFPSNPGSSSNMSFVRQAITKMAAAYQFASVRCCDLSNLDIVNRISSNFLYGLVRIWVLSDKR